MTDDRDTSLDLKWKPGVATADYYRAEHTITVSPASGAHMLIDLELPDGPSRLTITIEKQKDQTP